MIIRRATRGEAPALTALVMASKQSNGYDDAFMAACADELRVTPEDIDTQPYWVADDSGLLGCVCLSQCKDVGTIETFFIHTDHKRKGIGRALWHEVIREANNRKLTLLKLDADPEAVQFYGALGFKTVSEAPSGSIPGRMLPHMQLSLL